MLSFEEFFQSVTGNRPYKWQTQLYKKLSEGEWKDVLQAGTGTGKTSIIIIWYYILRQQLRDGVKDRLPMRLHYIIDRRTIVDDVYELAKRLKEVSGELEVIRLRGGLSTGEKEVKNAKSPSVPAIYVSTLDSYGSRVLFRGYGLSPKMRSFHCGLSFYDSLIVVDESHTAKPMLKLLARIKEIQGDRLPVSPPKVLQMSATPDKNYTRYELDFSDLAHLIKPKKVVLHEDLTDAKMLDKATSLVKESLKTHKCVFVVMNTVAKARAMCSRLKDFNVSLLTGQQRPYRMLENDMRQLQDYLKVKDNSTRQEARVVVATQTIEVGVNYNADVMISECASIWSIVQRAGRLNRFGMMPESTLHLLRSSSEDVIYGKQVDECVELIRGKDFPPEIDISPPEKDMVCLTDSDVDKLACTCPDLGFDVEPYLKGVETNTDVTVVWRDWLTGMSDDEVETASVIGVKPAEVVRIPLSALHYANMEVGDVRAWDGNGEGSRHSRFYHLPCVVRRYGKYKKTTVSKVRPGDLVILPTAYGGLDEWGWNQNSQQATDVYNLLKGSKFNTKRPKGRYLTVETANGVFYRIVGDSYDSSTKVTSLQDHTDAVNYYCRKFLKELGMECFLDDFSQAAAHHDLGKADGRFQRYMGRRSVLLGKPVGKMGSRVEPKGWRHELLSDQILTDSGIVISDLARHLILTHHGHMRPWAPEVVDNNYKPFKLTLNKTEYVSENPFGSWRNELFTKLNDRYGAWGLSYLEVVFRLADHAASCHKGHRPWKTVEVRNA